MKIELGKTGLKINPVGFGGIPIQRLTVEESVKIINEAIDAGINFFDTSRIYSDSETKMGKVFSKRRDEVIIATKSYSRDRENVLKDLDVSLKELQTDYIELFQLHNVSTEKDYNDIFLPDGALAGLVEAKKQGRIGHIGITGHKPWIVLEAMKKFDFATIQVPLNIIETECKKELLPFAKEKGAGVIAMKPVAGGALKNVPLSLRYILTEGADVVIPGMDKSEQIPDNLSVLQNLNKLTQEELNLLLHEKEELGDSFCRRCEYCMPCPEGLPVTFLHLLSAYYFRYDLRDWAYERIKSLPKSYKDCTACGACIKKCPYDLDSPEIFKDVWNRIQEDQKQ